MTIREKKDWAKLLYLKTNLNQKEIAAKVGVSQQTMVKWVDADRWDLLKSSFIVTREQELRRLYMQIHELNETISSRQEGYRFAAPKEADTLSKLASAARNLEHDTSLADTVNVFVEFHQWLSKTHPDKERDLLGLQDEYVNYKLSKL